MATPPNFSVGQVLTAAQMNAVGLWLIDEVALTTVTNNISNVFSSDFDAYKIVVSNLNNATSTTRQLNFRFRSGAGDDSTSNYWYGTILQYSSSAFNDSTSGQAQIILGFFGSGASGGGSITLDVINPNLAVASTVFGNCTAYQSNVSAYVNRTHSAGMNTTTQYTGFSIIGTTDNLSGTVRVYGYRK